MYAHAIVSIIMNFNQFLNRCLTIFTKRVDIECPLKLFVELSKCVSKENVTLGIKRYFFEIFPGYISCFNTFNVVLIRI